MASRDVPAFPYGRSGITVSLWAPEMRRLYCKCSDAKGNEGKREGFALVAHIVV